MHFSVELQLVLHIKISPLRDNWESIESVDELRLSTVEEMSVR